ncbi:N-acetyltransferase GCN5 [Allostella sp. ATCC 35155]|nr:N-acetyltransferase GCN5 [Stella sp. ATCC 35155]
MPHPVPDIAVMSAADLDLAVEWAADEGWNPGLSDALAFRAADPTGFLMARVDGAPAASISVVRYPGDFGFLGFYIACPPFRGRGHGYALWQAGMAYLSGTVVGLDGVPAQQANYARSGFVLAYRNVRFGGSPSGVRVEPGLVPLAEVPLDRLLAYDRRFFPAPRREFLAVWASLPHSHGYALLRDGMLAGYGVVRRCRIGWKIGPLFADDAAGAEHLFRGLAARAGEGPVFLDVPEVNPAAVALAERHGLAPAFETARMYRGPAPLIDLAGTWGITTFELG